MKIVVLASGGIDSLTTCLLYKNLGHEVLALFFDYGQATATKEQDALNAFGHRFDIARGTLFLPLHSIINKDDLYVPSRNSILISRAVAEAEHGGYDAVAVGFIKNCEGAYYPDASPEYIDAMRQVTQLAGIDLLAPLMEMDKQQVYKFAESMGIEVNDAWSCDRPVSDLDGEAFPCGKCAECKELAIFKKNKYPAAYAKGLDVE